MILLTLVALGISLAGSIPGHVAKYREARENKKLEEIVSKQGIAENNSYAPANGEPSLENVYLSAKDFTKYFGNKNSETGYIKSSGGNIEAKKFINLDSLGDCPLLEYISGMAEQISSSGNPISAKELKAFSLESIKKGAKEISVISSDSFIPGLIDANIKKIMDYYLSIGLIKEKEIDENGAKTAAYIINPSFSGDISKKRYVVESGSVKILGSSDKNYSAFGSEKITVMPLEKTYSINITNDKDYNKDVLENVLLHSDSLMLKNGTKITKGTSVDANNNTVKNKTWKDAIEKFTGQEIMLAPEQYINYSNLRKEYLEKEKAEEEEKKKKAKK